MNLSVVADPAAIALIAAGVCLVAGNLVDRRRLTRHRPMSRITLALDVAAAAGGLVAAVLSGFAVWPVVMAIGLVAILLVSLRVVTS